MKHFFDVVEDFIRAYFDKLLLTAILGHLLMGGAQYKDMANTVLGAIIMLTTGKVVDRLRNGNGAPHVNEKKEN